MCYFAKAIFDHFRLFEKSVILQKTWVPNVFCIILIIIIQPSNG